MKKLFAAVLLTAAILCAGCGRDKTVNKEGDTIIVDLPPGEKLINFASSQYDDYVVHRKRHQGESPEEYTVDEIHKGNGEQKSKYIVIREH